MTPFFIAQLYGRKGNYTHATWTCKGQQFNDDDYSRLYLPLSGSALITPIPGREQGQEKEIVMRPGRLYLLPTRWPFTNECTSDMTLLWAHLRIEVVAGLDLFHRYRPPAECPAPPGSEEKFTRMLSILDNDDPGSSFESSELLLSLLKPFWPKSWSGLLPDPPKVESLLPALNAMRENPAANHTLNSLAAKAHLHPTYFSNRFCEIMGIPPMRHLMNLRLRLAQRLLLEKTSPVETVAQACGFRDALYFSRFFKKHARMSPTQYRQRGGNCP